ncbi:hypothetical protein P9112_007424 [Eukaryota sp. TZLM1-RC]
MITGHGRKQGKEQRRPQLSLTPTLKKPDSISDVDPSLSSALRLTSPAFLNLMREFLPCFNLKLFISNGIWISRGLALLAPIRK